MITGGPASGKYRRQHETISLRLGVHSQPGSDYACDGHGLAVLVLGPRLPPLTRPRLLQRLPITEAIPLPVTNGEISGRIPTGATIPGENNGSMKIGAIITGEHSAHRKIGSSAGILKNKEHQIMRRKQDTLVV